MLFHPGCKPQRPIGPIALLTLATSSEDPSNEKQQQQQAGVGCNKTLVGLGRAAVPSGSQQLDAAQITPQQPSLGHEELQGNLSRERLNSDSTAKSGPSRTQEEVRGGAAAETLIVLVWVHPAAAREAWQTLKDLARGLGISCISRSANTECYRLTHSAFTVQELFCCFLCLVSAELLVCTLLYTRSNKCNTHVSDTEVFRDKQ